MCEGLFIGCACTRGLLKIILSNTKFQLLLANSESLRLQPKSMQVVMGVTRAIAKKSRVVEIHGAADLHAIFITWRAYHIAKDKSIMLNKDAVSETAGRSIFSPTAPLDPKADQEYRDAMCKKEGKLKSCPALALDAHTREAARGRFDECRLVWWEGTGSPIVHCPSCMLQMYLTPRLRKLPVCITMSQN